MRVKALRISVMVYSSDGIFLGFKRLEGIEVAGREGGVMFPDSIEELLVTAALDAGIVEFHNSHAV